MVRTGNQPRVVNLLDGRVIHRVVYHVRYKDGETIGDVRLDNKWITVRANTKNETLHWSYATWTQTHLRDADTPAPKIVPEMHDYISVTFIAETDNGNEPITESGHVIKIDGDVVQIADELTEDFQLTDMSVIFEFNVTTVKKVHIHRS